MKYKFAIILFIVFVNGISQKLEKQLEDFKISEESFLSENNKRISRTHHYFDNSGKVLEKINYGRHHYRKLNIIGDIEQFTYLNEQLISINKYSSSCKSCSFSHYHSVLKYNNDGKLLSEDVFYGEKDSLFMSKTYLYKPNITEVHFNSSTYYENKYDDEKRIIEQNQIFEDSKKTRWTKKYAYSQYNQVSKFQTYYGDGSENTVIEITTFNLVKNIISREFIREGSKTKLYYFYSKMGFIEKIEQYESYSDQKYELVYVTNFKIKKKPESIKQVVVKKINDELLNNKTSH